MENPLVTIVTPSFNQGEFIESTIQSVIAQTYPRIEYILMDGGSTDNSLEIIRKYQQHLTHWVSEPDQGQSHAINKGFQMACGQIWMWLNSDDVLLPGGVAAAVEAFLRFPDASLVFGDAEVIDRQGRILEEFHGWKHPRKIIDLGRRLPYSIPQPSVFMCAEMVKRAGFLNVGLNYAMDFDLFWRMTQHGRVIFFPSKVAQMRYHAGMKTTTHLKRNWQEKFCLFRKYNRRWFFSLIWMKYLLFSLLDASPSWLQISFRRLRGLPRDRIILSQTAEAAKKEL